MRRIYNITLILVSIQVAGCAAFQKPITETCLDRAKNSGLETKEERMEVFKACMGVAAGQRQHSISCHTYGTNTYCN
jgi:hypothetical protein